MEIFMQNKARSREFIHDSEAAALFASYYLVLYECNIWISNEHNLRIGRRGLTVHVVIENCCCCYRMETKLQGIIEMRFRACLNKKEYGEVKELNENDNE